MEMTRPGLSLCMIVRDSARTLADCLSSIRPWVDEIVVVDTGSIDNTKEIAHLFGARIFDFPWIDDFSAARNESLRHATGEWIFWMDSDDTIDEQNAKALRALVEGSHDPAVLGYVVQVHCPDSGLDGSEHTTVVDHIKLIRNQRDIFFEGRIHEQVLPSIRRLQGTVAWTELFVIHSGADHSPKGRRQKIDRDLRMLHLDLQDRPDHPFVLFNLGMTYEDIGEYAEAEIWLRRTLEMSHPQESHVRKAYALLASCLAKTGRSNEAITICEAGLNYYPDDVELCFRVGVLAQAVGDLDRAVAAYHSVLTTPRLRHFTSIDKGIGSYKAFHNLAIAHAHRGEPDRAELNWRRALELNPTFLPATRGLGQLLLQRGQLTVAEVLAEDQIAQLNNRADGWWLMAEILKRRGDYRKSDEHYLKAIERDPTNAEVHRAYCTFLFDHVGGDRAAKALQEFLSFHQDDAESHYRLGVVFGRAGHYESAVSHLQRSLTLHPDAPAAALAMRTYQDLMAKAATIRTESSKRLNSLPLADIAGLPVCEARYSIPDELNHFYCLHPRVHIRGQRAHAGICLGCIWANQAPSRLRPFPTAVPRSPTAHCVHLGDHIGVKECDSCKGKVRIKVFHCKHPLHVETTLKECQLCEHFEPRVQPSEHASESVYM